ncbi:MOS1T transposase, partial [Pseudoatta argentina]
VKCDTSIDSLSIVRQHYYYLISLDVVLLFTNIPLNLVIKSVEKRWNYIFKYCNVPKLWIFVSSLICSLFFFMFDDQIYKIILIQYKRLKPTSSGRYLNFCVCVDFIFNKMMSQRIKYLIKNNNTVSKFAFYSINKFCSLIKVQKDPLPTNSQRNVVYKIAYKYCDASYVGQGCNLLSTITGDRYRLQLMRLSRALKEKRPLYAQRHDKVILLHDNARPHVAKPVKTYLETLKWEVLPHPLYLAPSDFHLFRSMAHGLAGRRFHSYEEAQKWIDSWIASKDMSFFRRGIHVLPERWEKVVSSDGQYFK